MGFLHDKLDELKAKVGKAFNFAAPEQYIAEAEAEFKAHLVNAFHELEARVVSIEKDISTLFNHPAVAIPAVESTSQIAAAPVTTAQNLTDTAANTVEAAATQPAPEGAPVATLTVIADNALAQPEQAAQPSEAAPAEQPAQPS